MTETLAPTTEFVRRDPGDPAWQRTSLHESGHAIMAAHYGVDFETITLRTGRPEFRGALTGLGAAPHPLASMAIRLGGPAAAILFAPPVNVIGYLGSSCARDLQNAEADAATVDVFGEPTDLVIAVVPLVVDMVRAKEHDIRAVAKALLEHPDQRLTAAEVENAILIAVIARMRGAIDAQKETDRVPAAA